jgi:excisionase family DNA binding protein
MIEPQSQPGAMPLLAEAIFTPGVGQSQVFEQLLDVEQGAILLRIHPKTLQALARRGEVPCLRMGKYWRFRESSLDAWVQSKLICQHQSRRVQ